MSDANSFRRQKESPGTAPDRETALSEGLPSQERNQPDPMLQITTGHMGATGITLAALVIAVILGVVFYGLNSRAGAEHAAATHSAQRAAGGKAGPSAPTAPGVNQSGVKG